MHVKNKIESLKVIWVSSQVNKTEMHLLLSKTSLSVLASTGNERKKKKDDMTKKKMVSLKIRNEKPIELRGSIVSIAFSRMRDYIWETLT